MSGFVGIVRIEPDREASNADHSAIERMAAAIAFRGPDSMQQTQLGGGWFAFSLLKAGPAPQEEHQPCTIDGQTWFIGDARCDGREELRSRLAQFASLPENETSERLILRSFGSPGSQIFPALHGDLSFALWTPQDSKLVAYRDLIGGRPFFYSHAHGAVLFSNTLPALLTSGLVCRELDEQFLADFLLGDAYHDPSATVYREVRRLPPGHLLEFSKTGLTIRRVAHAPIEDLLVFKREEEYVEEFHRLFSQAVRDQLPDDETTILLSGGLDSPALAACAVAQRKEKSPNLRLRTFSVDLQPCVNDPEAKLAVFTANYLGLPSEVVHSGESLPFAGWGDTANLFPEPVSDPYSLLYHSYYRSMTPNTRVALSGNGGDEVLRLQALPYLKFLLKEQGAFSVLLVLSRYLATQRRLPPLGAGIRSGMQRMFGQKIHNPTFPPWFSPDFIRRLDLRARWHAMNSRPLSPHPFNPRAYSALNDFTFAPSLEFFDATWTGCPLELRNPFLDRRLTRFLLRVPLVPWAMEKHLLRRSQSGILPDEIRLRPKTPVVQDILLLHTGSGKWNPADVPAVNKQLQEMVDWPALRSCLMHTKDDSLHSHLRPVCLARWLGPGG